MMPACWGRMDNPSVDRMDDHCRGQARDGRVGEPDQTAPVGRVVTMPRDETSKREIYKSIPSYSVLTNRIRIIKPTSRGLNSSRVPRKDARDVWESPESEGIYNNLHQTDYGRYGRQAEQPEFKPAWAKMKLRTTQTGQKVRTGQYDDSPNKHIRRYADKEAGVAAVPSLSPRRKEGISVPPVNAEIAGAPFVETTPVVTPQRSSTVAAPTTTTTSVGNGAAVTTITTAPSTTSAVPQTVAVVATPPEDDSTDKKGGLKIIRKVRKVRKVRRDVQAHEEDVSTTPPPPVVVPDPVPTERMNYKLSDYYYNAKATPLL